MFRDAASVRRVVTEKQYGNPLEIEEICYAVRGRFQWDTQRKEWTVWYRPYRDYWLLLLLTVNERLFALQIPKVIPDKIVAQYEEQEEIARMAESLKRGEQTFRAPEGIQKRYLGITNIRSKMFERDTDKVDGNVLPEPAGLVRL